MPVGIRWPATLPPPLRDEYNTSYEETKKRTDMEVGMSRQRRLYRSEPRLEEVAWVMTQAQYSIFDRWWQNDIKKGSLLFDIQLRDELAGLIWYTARWMKTFDATIDSDSYEWRVKATLRLLGDPFTERPAGTNELMGRSSMALSATGFVQIANPMRGRSSMALSARGRFANGVLTGRAFMAMSGTGYIAKPLLGDTTLALSARGFLDNSLYGLATLDANPTGLFEVSLLGSAAMGMTAESGETNKAVFEIPIWGRGDYDYTTGDSDLMKMTNTGQFE